MSESIKKLLGLKDDIDINGLNGAKIFKESMKSGKISRKVIIDFGGHEITDEDKKSIACSLIYETNIKVMNEFMGALEKFAIESPNAEKKKRGRPTKIVENDGNNKGKKRTAKSSK